MLGLLSAKKGRGDSWRSHGQPCRGVLQLPVHKFGVLRYPYFSTPTSTLEPFPTRIVTSSFASVRLIRSPCFELQILATEPVSNTQVLLRALVRYTSITCISHIPLFTLPSFLSAKYLGQFRFQ